MKTSRLINNFAPARQLQHIQNKMENQFGKPYQPSVEEVENAKEMMTEEQKERSEERKETLKIGHKIFTEEEKEKKQRAKEESIKRFNETWSSMFSEHLRENGGNPACIIVTKRGHATGKIFVRRVETDAVIYHGYTSDEKKIDFDEIDSVRWFS